MDVKTALKEQFGAGLAMLAECVEKCPDDVWTSGTHPRAYWRIVFHAAFFTHLGMAQDEAAFGAPPAHLEVACREEGHRLWTDPGYLEPYEMPEDVLPYSKQGMLDYIHFVDSVIDATIDALDLETEDSGFCWYEDMSKMSNVLMTLRHIQGHVGQLSELLMARDIEIEWVGKR
jgi:hypothetical protein